METASKTGQVAHVAALQGMDMREDVGKGWLRWWCCDADDIERRLDERLDDSFPASDPPSHSPMRTQRPGFLANAFRGARNGRRHGQQTA